MSWVEVFKINSDMSKPLNIHISELISGLTTSVNTNVKSLGKLIEAQTRIVASDTYYASLNGATLSVPSQNVERVLNLPQKIKMTRMGSIRFKGVLGRALKGETKISFFIYKNDIEVYRYTKDANVGATEETFSTDILFEIGDVISFKLAGISTYTNPSANVYLINFTMNGTIEHNVFEVVS